VNAVTLLRPANEHISVSCLQVKNHRLPDKSQSVSFTKYVELRYGSYVIRVDQGKETTVSARALLPILLARLVHLVLYCAVSLSCLSTTASPDCGLERDPGSGNVSKQCLQYGANIESMERREL
jgi:hypothetical protein